MGGTSIPVNTTLWQLPSSLPAGTHTFTVTAIGDGLNYSNSTATAFQYTVQDGGNQTQYRDSALMQAFSFVNRNPDPNVSIADPRTWGQAVTLFLYSNLNELIDAVKTQLSREMGGVTITELKQLSSPTGGAGGVEIDITANTPINSATVIRAYYQGGGITPQRLTTPANLRVETVPVGAVPHLRWDSVPNAASYNVLIDGEQSIVNVTQFSLAALTAPGTYTIQVRAWGHGTGFGDSEWAVYQYTVTGGGADLGHENFTPDQLKRILDTMNGSPVPATIMTNWSTILWFFSTYSDLRLLLNDVMAAISADTGKNIVNIRLISNAPITPDTPFNQHYLIYWENVTTNRTLDRIQIVQPPRTTFTAGEQYHIGGGTVIAIYTDASSAPINGLFSIWLINSVGNFAEGNRPLTANDTFVRLSYTEGGITRTVDIAITVTQNTPPAEHKDFALIPILQTLNNNSGGNQLNLSATTWGGLLIPGSARFPDLGTIITMIISNVSAQEGGIFVEQIMQIGAASLLEISAQLPINSNTMIRAQFGSATPPPPPANEILPLIPILNALHDMPWQQLPTTITTWGELLPHYGRFASLPALINAVKDQISAQTGRTVVDIKQIGAAMLLEITMQTPIDTINPSHRATQIMVYYQ
jgi:hypothetical protein